MRASLEQHGTDKVEVCTCLITNMKKAHMRYYLLPARYTRTGKMRAESAAFFIGMRSSRSVSDLYSTGDGSLCPTASHMLRVITRRIGSWY